MSTIATECAKSLAEGYVQTIQTNPYAGTPDAALTELFELWHQKKINVLLNGELVSDADDWELRIGVLQEMTIEIELPNETEARMRAA